MVSSVSSATHGLIPDTTAQKQVTLANDTIKMLFKSEEVVQSLATLTSFYLPVDASGLTSTLWGLFNTSGARALKEEDVTRAVVAAGGTAGAAFAVWRQLSPDGKSEITGTDFALSDFVVKNVNTNLKSVQETVLDAQLARGNGGGVTTVLGQFESLGGNSIFDVFV